MRLYLIRHAHALPIAPGGDPHRTLSPAGHARALALGEAFAGGQTPFDLRPTRILSSPATRADQTARAIAQALSLSVEHEPRLGLSSSLDLVAQLVAELLTAETPAAAMIGHNPDLSNLAHQYGGSHLAPGEVVVCELDRVDAAVRGRAVGRF